MKTINRILFFTLVLIAYSCEDIIEEDISDEMVTPVSPMDNAEIESNVVTLQWNELNGADDYRIQVYNSGNAIVLDSLVGKTNLTHGLPAGKYQWRVRGENFAYKSSYSFPQQFLMIASDNLATQQVILSAPAEGYINKNSITFSWQSLAAATTYDFQLINVTDNNSLAVEKPGLTTTNVTLEGSQLAEDAVYQWKVKAINSSSNTPFASRSFSLDRIAPNQPQLTFPANNSVLTAGQSINFEWSSAADSGIIMSPISYTIQFATDPAFTMITQTSSSPTTVFPQVVTQSGTLYWRVQAKDAAKNISSYSQGFKITVN